MPDGGVVAIDWAVPEDVDKTSLIVILFHGLAGGSNETYICEQTFSLLEKGHTVACLNYRGSNGLPLKTPQLYAGSYTADVRLIIKHIKQAHPQSPLIGVGYSLGANILVKYVGEEGAHCPLIACVSVANPFDFNVGINFLHSSFLGRLYSRIMTRELVSIFNQHLHMFPSSLDSSSRTVGFEDTPPVSPTKVKSSRFLTDFDEQLTRRVFGYRTVNEFYRMGGSAQYIPDVRIPTLLLNALDDPVALSNAIPVADIVANPFTILATTRCGGHLGWFESLFGFGTGYKRWFTRPVLEFVEAIHGVYDSLPVHLRSSFIEHNTHALKANHVHYKGKHSVIFQHHHQNHPNGAGSGSGVGAKSASLERALPPLKVDVATSANITPSYVTVPPKKRSSKIKPKPSASSTSSSSSSFLVKMLKYVCGLTSSASIEGQMIRRFVVFVCAFAAVMIGSKNRKQILGH
ncbi:Alpha/Beta hydrolase protein [Obelidium mucronatum]|nr:Alpha/Beta hydrolase protein [Obelidium mucronatum]